MCFAVALLLLSVPTLDALFASRAVWLRAAALVPGAVLAACCLVRVLKDGHVTDGTRQRWLFFLAGIHIVATLFFFPVEHLFDARPILTADHAVHYAQCLRSKEIFWQTFRLDCYSPYFMAGYPAGTVFDLDMKGAELFTALFPIHTATALKLFVLIAYLSMLPSVYRAARMLGFHLEEGMFGVMLLLAYWHWGRPYASDFRYVGMFSFVFATHGVLYVTGLVRRYLAGDRGTALFLLGPIVFLVHVLSIVMAAVPMLAVLIVDRARLTRRRAEVLAMWVLVIVFVNALWILPLVRFLPYKTPTEDYYQLHGIAPVAALLLKPSGLIALGLLSLSFIGCLVLARERRLGAGAPCAAGALTMLVFAAVGVFLPGINQLEPGRFLFSAVVFASPLAGTGMAWLVRAITARLAQLYGARIRAAVTVALALAPLPLAMLDAKAYYQHTLTFDLPPRVDRLRAAVVSLPHLDGRLMIEEGSVHAYDGFFLPALLPSQTQTEQIGGPFPYVPLLHHRTSFDDRSFLGKSFDAWPAAEAEKRLRFLRVRRVVTATDEATRFVARIPGIVVQWEEGPLRIWELPAGGPEIAVGADYNHVRADAPVGARFVVLPYHWVEGLKTSDGNQIVPVFRDDDPVPFICIRRVVTSPVNILY